MRVVFDKVFNTKQLSRHRRRSIRGGDIGDSMDRPKERAI